MLEKINPYAPHIITGTGVAFNYLGVPYGNYICYAGLLLTGLYYLLIEIKSRIKLPKYFKIILFVIPALIILLVGQSFLLGDNNFMMIILLIVMYSFIKVKVDRDYERKSA